MYEYKAQVVRVIDGDTLEMDVDLGFHTKMRHRFRLLGVDTPELNSKVASERETALKAKAFTEQAVNGTTVVIRTEKADSFGRWLATVIYKVDGADKNLSEELLKNGLAVVFKG